MAERVEHLIREPRAFLRAQGGGIDPQHDAVVIELLERDAGRVAGRDGDRFEQAVGSLHDGRVEEAERADRAVGRTGQRAAERLLGRETEDDRRGSAQTINTPTPGDYARYSVFSTKGSMGERAWAASSFSY